jgi:hypothetical protein
VIGGDVQMLKRILKAIRKFTHDKLGWHLQPLQLGFDGCSLFGICPYCGKKVLQDSQGNWFMISERR